MENISFVISGGEGQEYTIPLKFQTVNDFYNFINAEDITDEYDEFVDSMEEKYGNHDFYGEGNLIGYCSTEITDWDNALKDWTNFWAGHQQLI